MKNILIKVTIIIIVVIFILFIIYILIGKESNYKCPEPNKPVNVPKEAIWSGSCDGGNWILLISDSLNFYRFKVYNDYSGTLEIDALYIPEESFKKINLTKANWAKLNPIFTEGIDSLVYIDIGDLDNFTRLKVIYPAYSGELWEIIKEKYKIDSIQ